MSETKIYSAINKPNENEKNKIVDFLFENLDEFGDPKEDIRRAIDYSIKEFSSFGGFTLVQQEGDVIVGAVVLNRTGMDGYIPENILVYIATHKAFRGRGIGKSLMRETIHYSRGDIALHVAADNTAKHMYTKLGFTNPYLEMRLKR